MQVNAAHRLPRREAEQATAIIDRPSVKTMKRVGPCGDNADAGVKGLL